MQEIATWSDPALPFRIQYSREALERIRATAMEGLMALPKVGMGTGGVLLGEYEGSRIVVLDSIEIPCSHAFGPSFSLTSEELEQARELVANLDASRIVGWYCSKGLRPLEVSDTDRIFLATLFANSWRAGLLLRPDMFRPAMIAFFSCDARGQPVKGAEGELAAWAALQPIGAVEPAAPPATAVAPTKVAQSAPQEPPAGPLPQAFTPDPAPSDPDIENDIDLKKQIFTIDPALWPTLKREREAIPWNPERPVIQKRPGVSFDTYRAAVKEPPPKKVPTVAIAVVAAVLMGIAGVVLVVLPEPHQGPPRPPLILHSTDVHGALTIQWNLAGVEGIDHASLFIDDGGRLHTFPLDRSQLTSGEFRYARKSGHVKATVTADGSQATTEFTAPSGKASSGSSRP